MINSKDKAPDNMPTETICAFIRNSQAGLQEAIDDEKDALAALHRAINNQVRLKANIDEYEGWLWVRENNSLESNE